MRRISRLKRSLGVSALASVLLLSGLAAAAAPAAANDVMCTRSGNTLTWNAPANNSPVHVRGWVDNVNSKWLTKLAGQTSYNLTATDLAKAPADLFFIRFTTGGVRTDVQCTNGPGNPGGNGFCQQDGTTLTWSQESPKNNVFHVRKVNADFSTSWVATVQAANPNTYQAPSANDSYVIRYRKTNQLGQTNVINENCSQDAEPPASVDCSVQFWGIVQDWGYHVILEGTVIGDSWTLLLDGVPSGTRSAPFDPDDIMDGVENIYFFVDFQATPKLNVDVAPTNDLTAVVPCGSIGEDPGAVTSCVAYEGEDPSTVTVSLNEGPLASFGVAVDGVAVNPADIETLFADIPGPAVVTGYQVPALLTSAITITQAGGDVDCTGDEANFCTQFAGSLEWLSVADIWNDEYNVRRVNADGSTTWVRTNIGEQASSALAGPGDYLIRYRIEDAQGNQTVFDNVCVPN